jgi:hypothetical protein
MAEKVDLRNLGADLSLPQYQFLLGLSSGLPDIVPSRGIRLAQLMLSSDSINGTINNISCPCSLTVSAAADRR